MPFLLFGDDTAGNLPAIRKLVSEAKSSRLVPRFLRRACDAVQLEVGQLPLHSEQRCNVGSFDTIVRLAEENAQLDKPNEIIEIVLMNIVRLGELILSFHPRIAWNPQLYTGILHGEVPAAFAAVARDTSELVELAVEATHIIFRLARELSRRSVMIDKTHAPWSQTVVGIPQGKVQDILDEFHEKKFIPRARQVCIGRISESWLTLFGPPKTLQGLVEWSNELGNASKPSKNGAHMGLHMESLPELDIKAVLGSSLYLTRNILPAATLISPYTCKSRDSRTLGELLTEIISDIGRRPLQVAGAMKAALEAVRESSLRLVIPGYTDHETEFVGIMETCGVQYSAVRHSGVPRTLTQREGSNFIAVVGMSGRFPGSGSVNEFWENLLEGKRYVQEILESRFNLDKWYDATGKMKNSTSARTGAFIDKPGMFDNRFFNMSPREAMQTDVQQRLLLTTAHEALEMAGYSPDSTPSTNRDRISSYFGQTSDDWRQIVFNEGADIYYMPGNCRAFACASSISAVSLACSDLLSRKCDMALAGGGSIMASPAPFSGLSRGGFLSTHGGCQTFMDNADGYTRGEGIGVVVLKRLEDAIAEKDNILGLIRGFGRNYSSDTPSITRPSAAAQQQLYHDVLERSNTSPNDISYVEMHGTGTQAGDSLEMSSVLSTFAENRGPDNPLVVGAVKASIAHGESASGVCALIKTLMMLQTRKIPPQPDLPGPINSKFPDLISLNVHIASRGMTLSPSPTSDGTLRVFLNCFDASGGNSCLLLEEAPLRQPKCVDPRNHHVITLSARSKKSLVGIKKRYLTYLRQNPNINLADLAYSTTARRMHHPLRYAIAASSIEGVVANLENDLGKNTIPRAAITAPEVVFVFTGQGSSYREMGSRLWETSTTFRSTLSGYQDMASAQGLPYFLHLIHDETTQETETEPDSIQMQLALLSFELALAELWRLWGVQPAMVIGHSLGEYAALCVAGVLSVSDALYLVGTRARIASERLVPGEFRMLAVSQNVEQTRKLLSGNFESCSIACINTSNVTVVSGPRPVIEVLQARLKPDGIQSTLLSLPYGFHSSQLDPILAQFEESCQGVAFSAPKILVASTLLGAVVDRQETFSPEYLARQTREPVDFVGALQAMQGQKLSNMMFIEVGPDPICLGFITATFGVGETKNRCLPSVQRDRDNWESISSTLKRLYTAGLQIDWTAYHHDFKSSLALLELPFYAFDEKEFWVSFLDPESEKGVADDNGQTPDIVPSVHGYPTTTLQRIVSEDIQEDLISVTFESSLSDPHLRDAIRGHSLVDVDTCPSSFLMDMALSATQYAYLKHTNAGTMDIPLTVQKTRYHQALVLTGEDQTLVVNVKFTPKTNTADIRYACRTLSENYELGVCQVILGSTAKLSQADFLVRSRVAELKASAHHKLGKRVVYHLFENAVRYSEPYQALENVYLGESMQDVVGEVNMKATVAAPGHYLHHPFLLDAMTHLSGFLLNNGLQFSDKLAFVSTGFDTWHLSRSLNTAAVYTSYTYMEDSPLTSNMITSHVYVYQGNDLVSVLSGIRFQKMKKTALKRSLSITSPSRIGSHATTRPETPEREMPGSPIIHRNPSVANPEPDTPTVVTVNDRVQKSSLADIFLKIVVRETGIDVSDLEDDVRFDSLGLDSLMTLTVISAMHQESGLELPATFFHNTVRSAVLALGN
ncbi:Non-reducing polyketide synthase PKS16 [Cladobotryum mycophilum]|uniref:Non-reducing polyketide synthase PKS16 n=1 Tax=Cladobotryum mycophilum TaxID=491253 RepID=A0ABR0T4A4_9HYPO